MFVAMNRFRIIKGQEEAFEEVWRSRDGRLKGLPGFVEFHLLKGPEADDHVLYASHTIWQSRHDFENWTRSDAFRQAHKNAGQTSGMYIGGPHFEGFEAVSQIKETA